MINLFINTSFLTFEKTDLIFIKATFYAMFKVIWDLLVHTISAIFEFGIFWRDLQKAETRWCHPKKNLDKVNETRPKSQKVLTK